MRANEGPSGFLADAFVRAVAAVRVNEVHVGPREVRKVRRRGAGAVIAAGNVWFGWAGAQFRMFPRIEAWVSHEQRMFQLLHGRSIRREGRALVMPRLPGEDLLAVARADAGATEPFFHAGRALAVLHGAGLTHGDVNLGNVLVDGPRAAWIDFDAAHDERLPLPVRAADDLVGLVLDLDRAGGDFERRFAAFVEGYGRPPEVVAELRAVASPARPPSFLGWTLLRARAHGQSAAVVEERLLRAAAILGG